MPEPWIGNASSTGRILQQYDLRAQKKFGQNFLVDAGVLKRIVDAAELSAEDYVLEIGPGLGTMTQVLAAEAKEVCAVEIDRNLIPVLKDTLRDFPNVRILNQDILETDIETLFPDREPDRKIQVAANLPYYITTPIVMNLLENETCVQDMVFLVQKEVAQRMQAKPGSKEYGALSLAVQYYSDIQIIAHVPPGCFIPRPKVDSTVVRLSRHACCPVSVKNPAFMFRVIRAAFNQRRKTLANGLGNSGELSCSKVQAQKAICGMGMNENIRGEALSLEAFAALSDVLLEMENNKEEPGSGGYENG